MLAQLFFHFAKELLIKQPPVWDNISIECLRNNLMEICTVLSIHWFSKPNHSFLYGVHVFKVITFLNGQSNWRNIWSCKAGVLTFSSSHPTLLSLCFMYAFVEWTRQWLKGGGDFDILLIRASRLPLKKNRFAFEGRPRTISDL